jgi:HK97 family phage major capsid protein
MSDDMIKALGDLDTKLGQKFEAYEATLKEQGSVSAGLKADLKAMSDDFAGIKKDVTAANDAILGIKQKGVKLDTGEKPVSMGSHFVASESFKNYRDGKSNKASLQFKNTILGEGGDPQNPTNDIVPLQTMTGIVGGAFRALRVLDILPRGQATNNTVHYTREGSWTNGAAETAEGAQKPEATLTFEGLDVPVRTIAHFLKLSKQVLDDAPALQSYIDQRLRHGVQQRAEAQVIGGNGTSPNIAGMSATGNHVDLVIDAADKDLDALSRAKYQVIASDYMADVYLMNPADWGRIERTKTGITDDGRYLAGGDNAISYLANGIQPLLWGLPVILSNNVPAGQFFCMSRDAVMFWERQGVTVEIFDQNEDDVEKNLLTIRGEMRGAFTTFRPSAVVYGALPDA